MKRLFALLLAMMLTAALAGASAEGVVASLNQKIAIRSGPATSYDDMGTFLISNWKTSYVSVISKAQGSGVWWVQVEFFENNRLYRAYTGLKRVNVNENLIPEEVLLGTGSMIAAGNVTAYYGPGPEYAVMKNDVPWSVDVTVWGAENGYLLVDFFDEAMNKQRRAWVYAELAEIDWINGAPYGSLTSNQAAIQSGDVYSMLDREDTRCTVLQYGQPGEYSLIELSLFGQINSQLLTVAMEGSDFGTFTLGSGNAEVWFSEEEIVIEAYLPEIGLNDVIILLKNGTMPQ